MATVLLARWALPQAPPLYDGINITPQPYQYCSPPANLKSSNIPPTGGSGDLAPINGVSKLGTVETGDKQVVVFFAQGVFKLSSGTIHVTVDPLCSSPPPPPPHSTIVGNVYDIKASLNQGGVAASPPPLLTPAQVLLRVPRIAYNTARVFYDGSWHDTQFGAQADLINMSLDHLGAIAVLNDSSLQKHPQPPATFSFGVAFEVGLVVVALLIIIAGIIAQRRRTAASSKK